ncbi:MAG: HEAT repeat domain-containing protein, partial [Saprospiraceae bacterium]
MKTSNLLLIASICLLAIQGCKQEIKSGDSSSELLSIKQDSASAVKMAMDIKSQTAIKLAGGLQISLWATDSLAPDPVGMDIDYDNNVYLTRTNRQKNSEFDIRGYPQWMTPSISFQSVDDRRAFLHKTFAPEKSEENKWLPDLNADSIHDWHDLAVEKEEVWKLTDKNGDGIADISTRIINDFNDEVTDILAGILVREKDMFLTVGPDVWRLEDTNGDGVMDKKTSIATGFSVHIGFSGHNLSGIIEGPDGKIYWNIGDIGGNITDKAGNKYPHPNEGMILRSNPDGSDFEVYAQGLRNTHEFVFDEYGNLISSDNDGDHRGESERLVHVVEGSDAGWRSNWQYGKYTDPKNNRYHVWMDEKLSIPRWEGQAAYIIPPIQNFHNGPTGMVYNPGTALGKDWLHKFFLVEFVGNPSSSHIWAFDLKPKGASFDLKTDLDLVSGILPTGIRFGMDGALYAADWVNGWNTKNYGRVWKIDAAPDKNDLKVEREEVLRIMKQRFSTLKEDQLGSYLKHGDQRIRQRAQIELASRGEKGYSIFKNAISHQENQLERIHGIWGIGQLLAKTPKYAEDIKALLNDKDEEIIVQALKVLGNARITDAGSLMLEKLNHKNPRIQFFAAQGLGRIKYSPAFDGLIQLVVNNRDSDVYIRHAVVLALSRIGDGGDVTKLSALSSNASRSAKIAAVLALRRLRSPEIKVFLNDQDEYIVAEA